MTSRRSPGHLATALAALALVAGGCGSSSAGEVAIGTYGSLVPTIEQLDADVDGALPGGVAELRADDVELVEVVIDDEQVVIRLDGAVSATRTISERIAVTDSEGSGPFKGKKQILVLGDEPLVLGRLIIDEPVIWPGSFENSPVITLKPADPDERGPAISCDASEPCLLLSSGVDPAGRYEDANNPELDQNPVDFIEIGADVIEITLDGGEVIGIPVDSSSTTRACGLSESRVWDLPPELGLPIGDPVLIHTLCPSTPGAAIQLVIMDRSAVPVLAPLTEAREGDWCQPAADCLVFNPT